MTTHSNYRAIMQSTSHVYGWMEIHVNIKFISVSPVTNTDNLNPVLT